MNSLKHYLLKGGRSERRTHGGNKCKHTRARDVTRDNYYYFIIIKKDLAKIKKQSIKKTISPKINCEQTQM